jgi:uncharacterized protein DUF222
MLATQDLCSAGRVDLRAEERRERLIHKRRVIDMLEFSFSREAAEFASTDDYEKQGSVSAIDWIRIHCHMTGPAASDRVAVGKLVPQLGQTVNALAEGKVGFAHLTVMARTADAVGAKFNEGSLLKNACENSPGKFHHICRHYRHAVDASSFNAEHVEQVENRRLSLSTWFDGSVLISGVLDSFGGAALRTALEPLARKSGAHDDRKRERRLADALVDLSMHALDTGLVPQSASQRTHLQVTTSLETLLALDGCPAAELEFALPISAKTVERLACDCSVTRILLGSDSMVIDVGRAKRVISGPQRKALNARDGGCTWPGCDRPASWTSGHHLHHWARGGPGDLPNLTLLCYRHHWNVHEGNWQLVRGDDGRILTVPPTVTFGLPRGPD